MPGSFFRTAPILLNQMPFRLRRSLGSTAMQTAVLEPVQQVGRLAEQMMYELSVSILAGRVSSGTRECSVPFPASWWQHWKMEHGPKWLVKRWPVKFYTTKIKLDFTRWCTFPLATVPLPSDDFGAPVVFDSIETFVDSPNGAAPVKVGPGHLVDFANRKELEHALWMTWVYKSGDYSSSLIPAKHVISLLESTGVNPDQLVRKNDLDTVLRGT